MIFNLTICYAAVNPIHKNAVEYVFKDAAAEFKEKFNLDFQRTSIDQDELVRRISIYFRYSKTMTQEKARDIMPRLLDLALLKINQNPKLQEYLMEHPFRKENLHITIYMPSSFFPRKNCAIIGWNNKEFTYLLNNGTDLKEEPRL